MTYSKIVAIQAHRTLWVLPFLLVAHGCSGHVELGGAAVASPPDPVSSEVELASRTTNLLKLNQIDITGFAVDSRYLYLNTHPVNDPTAYHLQRCEKSRCFSTLVALKPTALQYLRLSLFSGRLGWVDSTGLNLCHAPGCDDLTLMREATFAAEPGVPVVWDEKFVYWQLNEDRAIYRCDLPNCASGPTLVASQAMATNLEVADGTLYWLDRSLGVMRVPESGSPTPERLSLGEQTNWSTSAADASGATDGSFRILSMQLDGHYLYAALTENDSGGHGAKCGECYGDFGCSECKGGVRIARYPYTKPGESREWLLDRTETFEKFATMRVFDGELVWSTTDNEIWSCRAERCATTKRQLGVKNAVWAMQESYLAADEKFIYWLSAEDVKNDDASRSVVNLKRTPRISD